MEKKLTLEEQPAFLDISSSIGEEDVWHTLEDIRGVLIQKNYYSIVDESVCRKRLLCF